MSVSTERPQESPPRGPGGIKREHIIWAAAGLIIVLLGVGFAFVLAQRNVEDEGTLLGQEQEGGEVTAIGPLNGTELPPYIATRKEALDKASGERVAVVSLDRYVTANEATSTAGGMQVIAMLAEPPGATPTVVKGDIRAWAKEQKDAAAAEKKETQELLKTTDDPDFRPFYQSEVARLDKVIAALNPDGPVVFAIVVQGQADQLKALGQKGGIRLVDVGVSAKVADGAEYRGVRPWQTGKANQTDPRP